MLAGAAPPDLVAVVVGPGSFTGLRAGISLAAGLALGWAVPAIGVGVAEALAEAFAGTLPGLDGRCLWTAIQARRGRIFLGWDGRLWGVATDALPIAQGRIAVCGNAANLVAGTLAARGTDVMLTAARAPDPIDVARLAVRRMRGEMPPLDAAPLYVDAPEAKRPEAPRGPPQ
jgi:tRNA threonylcarbamoyladenosine biosynthesis protein TsaB